MIISFGHTCAALLAGRKTCTRRDWSERTAEYFTRRVRSYHGLALALEGVTIGVATEAYDKSPRNGGKKVAMISVHSVTRELLSDIPDSDYEAEGFAWLDEHGDVPLDPWNVRQGADFIRDWRGYLSVAKQSSRTLYVVRFHLAPVASTVDLRL